MAEEASPDVPPASSPAAPMPPKKKRWWRWPIRFLLALILLEAILQAPVYLLPNRLTVSPETTYLTSPLRPDGSVDYPAAIDAELSQGVTQENNAAILLANAVGPGKLLNDQQVAILGVKYDPAQMHFQKWEDWAKRNVPVPNGVSRQPASAIVLEGGIFVYDTRDGDDLATFETFDLVEEIKKNRDLPEVRKWLEEMAPALELAIEASRRDRFYVPLATREGIQVREADPKFAEVRELARALWVRANLYLRQGEFEKALADILAIKRLGFLVAQQQTFLSQLVGVTIQALASTTAADAAIEGRLTASNYLRFAREFMAISAAGDWGKAARYCRLETLDMLHEGIALALRDEDKDKIATVNLNDLARRINRWCDGLEDSKIPKKLPDYRTLTSQRTFLLRAGGIATRGILADEIVNDIMLSLIPAYSKARFLYREGHMDAQLSHMALLLAAWHAETGIYPDTLDAVAKKYGATVPQDVLSAQPDTRVKYRRIGKGYTIYSVGPVGENDGSQRNSYTVCTPPATQPAATMPLPSEPSHIMSQ